MACRLDLAIVHLSFFLNWAHYRERRRECLQKIAPLQRFWPRLRFDHRFGSRPFRPAAFRTFKHFHVRKFLDVAQAILKLAMAACRRHEAVWAGRHLSSPLVRAACPARIQGGPANPLGGRKVDWVTPSKQTRSRASATSLQISCSASGLMRDAVAYVT